jgi:molecular chaperone HscC
MTILGIDLGTTNSLACYWDGDKPVLISNALGSVLTPSVVSLGEDGQILVGQIAKERLVTHPQLSAATFKRYMGSRKELHLGIRPFLPEELSSFVIRSLKQDAEAFLGKEVTEAVISVPAYFNDAQRRATKRAGELAGLKIERLINEPTAAATAYGLHGEQSETKFIVFDLGGGTFDVSIVEIFENLLEVRAVAGDNYLGGEDFTELLASLFLQHHQLNGEELNDKELAAVYKQAEQLKQNLSRGKAAEMRCVLGERELTYSLTHDKLEKEAEGLLRRLRYPVVRALQDASLRPENLDAVILVGGATRMPLIHAFVSKLFGHLPACSINPDEAVAIGAGIQAGMKARNLALKEVVLTDVCPYTLGTDIVRENAAGYKESGYFFPIIERNTVIPASRIKRLYTARNNQNAIEVEVFQGESRLTKNNIELGRLEIPVPPGPAGREAIDIRFTYDINGILEVEVTAVSTGVKRRAVIEETPGSMPQAEIEARLAALAALKIHPRDKQENQLLLARGERLYEEALGDTREIIALWLAAFEQALDRQEERKIKPAAAVLKQRLDSLEQGYF